MKLTDKQKTAVVLLGGPETHDLLVGGSRSGKTFILTRAVAVRAICAGGSRHAILRFRFNHVKSSIILDTFPKMMKLCFPKIKYHIDKTDWYAKLGEDSEIWFGGLDDKERTEKVLGQEHATIYLNEASQIPYSSRNYAVTRLAQNVTHKVRGEEVQLRRKMYYDANPPSTAHWLYKLFYQGVDLDGKPIDRTDFAAMYMNPGDNIDNLPAGYIKTLESLPARMRLRFLDGRFASATANALWTLEDIEKYRVLEDLPDMQRVVVAVDPSGSDDTNNLDNDEIGIVVAGLGIDGNGYLLEDASCKTGPAGWGRVVATTFERHAADTVVGETNFGGAMVKHVVLTARKRTPFKAVTASRGKVVRAEPISALAEQGRIRHAGYFPKLEDELTAFTTAGYVGEDSPNRADAYVWAMSELFGEIVKDNAPAPVIDEWIPCDAGMGLLG